MGFNSIAIVMTGYQLNIESSNIDWEINKTTSIIEVNEVIKVSKQLGFSIMLKPHVDLSLDPTHWRGDIGSTLSSTDIQKWFVSYESFLIKLAYIAMQNSIENLCIGTELKSLSRFTNEWENIISNIRKIFNGKITYAANHDEVDQIEWLELLDHIGIDAYFSLTDNISSTLNDMKNGSVSKGHTRFIEKIYEKFNKPIIFTEIGYRSINNTTCCIRSRSAPVLNINS